MGLQVISGPTKHSTAIHQVHIAHELVDAAGLHMHDVQAFVDFWTLSIKASKAAIEWLVLAQILDLALLLKGEGAAADPLADGVDDGLQVGVSEDIPGDEDVFLCELIDLFACQLHGRVLFINEYI